MIYIYYDNMNLDDEYYITKKCSRNFIGPSDISIKLLQKYYKNLRT